MSVVRVMITVAPASSNMRWSCSATARLASASRKPVGPVAPPGGCPGSSAIRGRETAPGDRSTVVDEYPAGGPFRSIGYGSRRVNVSATIRTLSPSWCQSMRRSGCRSARSESSRCRPRHRRAGYSRRESSPTRETVSEFPPGSGRLSGSPRRSPSGSRCGRAAARSRRETPGRRRATPRREPARGAGARHHSVVDPRPPGSPWGRTSCTSRRGPRGRQ